MKRFALILAIMMLLLPMTGCGDAGSGGSPPAAATPDEETSPAPKGKTAKIQRPAGPADGANPAGPKNDR
jgi:predicted small lipoprotein YifL